MANSDIWVVHDGEISNTFSQHLFRFKTNQAQLKKPIVRYSRYKIFWISELLGDIHEINVDGLNDFMT